MSEIKIVRYRNRDPLALAQLLKNCHSAHKADCPIMCNFLNLRHHWE